MFSLRSTFVAAAFFSLAGCGGPRDTDARRDANATGDAAATDGRVADGDLAPDAARSDATPADSLLSCTGSIACRGRCVDLATDVQNCGGCGNDCSRLPGVLGALARCVSGLCEVSAACAPGRGHCSRDPFDGCEADLTSAARCGDCATRCSGATPLCAARGATGRVTFECVSGCMPDAPTRCGDACVNTSTSAAHCGGCGNTCMAGPHAIPSCVGSRCAFSCEAGYGNCDGDWNNGCEVSLRTDRDHCGVCGNACPVPDGASATCVSATCDFVCNSDRQRCGGACVTLDDPDYGCGRATCTACALAANAHRMRCESNACVVAVCNAEHVQCDGRCVSVNDPAYGCGAGDCRPCAIAPNASAMACSPFGTCYIASCALGFKLCGGRCVPMTDPAYGCGAATCGRCLVDHATPACAASGACDYTTCAPGWRDLDGDRSNGCETEAPPNLAGLRVWLSVAEPGSLEVDPRCASRGCVRSWRNLADPANSATQTDPGQAPSVAVRADGSGGPVWFGTTGAPRFGYIPGERSQHTLAVDLGFMTFRRYSMWIVATPIGGIDENYTIGCEPRDPWAWDTGLHFGWRDDATIRLGHFGNDLDAATRADGVPTILHGRLTTTGRVVSARRNGGVFTFATDTRTNSLQRMFSCAIGRGHTSGGSTAFRGAMYEVVLYDRALDTTEAARVELYLRRRWSVW